MKPTTINLNLADTVMKANEDKKADKKYSVVSASIEDMNKTLHNVNVEAHNALYKSCATFSDFFRACVVTDKALKVNKTTKAFEIGKKETILSLESYVAYRNVNFTKEGKGDILPEGFRSRLIDFMATLAFLLVLNTEGIDIEAEKARIEKAYNVTVKKTNKKTAKAMLHKLANELCEGVTISGEDLTKVMLSVFAVNPLTWKVVLPKQDTLFKAFSAMMHCLIEGNVNSGLIEDIVTSEEKPE